MFSEKATKLGKKISQIFLTPAPPDEYRICFPNFVAFYKTSDLKNENSAT